MRSSEHRKNVRWNIVIAKSCYQFERSNIGNGEVVFIEGLCKPHVWSIKMFSLHIMLIKSLHPKLLARDAAVKG